MIRWLLRLVWFVLMMSMLISVATAQPKVTTADMYVTTVYEDTTIQEHRKIQMGTLDDRMCLYVDYIICFDSVRIILIRPGDVTAIAISELRDRHMIRQVRSEKGFCIWITNLDRQYPHWFLSTTPALAK